MVLGVSISASFSPRAVLSAQRNRNRTEYPAFQDDRFIPRVRMFINDKGEIIGFAALKTKSQVNLFNTPIWRSPSQSADETTDAGRTKEGAIRFPVYCPNSVRRNAGVAFTLATIARMRPTNSGRGNGVSGRYLRSALRTRFSPGR